MNAPAKRSSDTEAQLQSEWAARQHTLGNQPQAVLMKNLPPRINGLLDAWHRTLLRWSFGQIEPKPTRWIADLGCGYGRLANTMKSMGFTNIVGLDFEAGFCRQYQLDHGAAVRGSIAQPPFVAASLSGAYAITGFMYVELDRAAEGLKMLDASLLPGARVLLLEAGAEFNAVSRIILRRKRTQSLAVNGFTCTELGKTLLPIGWQKIATGSNAGMTALLPLLMIFNRWPWAFDVLSALATRVDRPRLGFFDQGWRRFCVHRWIVCEKPLGPVSAVAACQETSTAARRSPEMPSTQPAG